MWAQIFWKTSEPDQTNFTVVYKACGPFVNLVTGDILTHLKGFKLLNMQVFLTRYNQNSVVLWRSFNAYLSCWEDVFFKSDKPTIFSTENCFFEVLCVFDVTILSWLFFSENIFISFLVPVLINSLGKVGSRICEGQQIKHFCKAKKSICKNKTCEKLEDKTWKVSDLGWKRYN